MARQGLAGECHAQFLPLRWAGIEWLKLQSYSAARIASMRLRLAPRSL
jgi:hypothetical protein